MRNQIFVVNHPVYLVNFFGHEVRKRLVSYSWLAVVVNGHMLRREENFERKSADSSNSSS